MSRILRNVTMLALVLMVAVTASSCGRKEKLTPPRGSDYPRTYPRE
jgi:hypothetical protein